MPPPSPPPSSTASPVSPASGDSARSPPAGVPASPPEVGEPAASETASRSAAAPASRSRTTPSATGAITVPSVVDPVAAAASRTPLSRSSVQDTHPGIEHLIHDRRAVVSAGCVRGVLVIAQHADGNLRPGGADLHGPFRPGGCLSALGRPCRRRASAAVTGHAHGRVQRLGSQLPDSRGVLGGLGPASRINAGVIAVAEHSHRGARPGGADLGGALGAGGRLAPARGRRRGRSRRRRRRRSQRPARRWSRRCDRRWRELRPGVAHRLERRRPLVGSPLSPVATPGAAGLLPSLATRTGAATSTEPIWPATAECRVVCLALGVPAHAGGDASASARTAPSTEALRII